MVAKFFFHRFKPISLNLLSDTGAGILQAVYLFCPCPVSLCQQGVLEEEKMVRGGRRRLFLLGSSLSTFCFCKPHPSNVYLTSEAALPS